MGNPGLCHTRTNRRPGAGGAAAAQRRQVPGLAPFGVAATGDVPREGERNRTANRETEMGENGSTFTVGGGGDSKRPFTTDATDVATGPNADEVDGRSAEDVVGGRAGQERARRRHRLKAPARRI